MIARFRVYDSRGNPLEQCQGPTWAGACSRGAPGQIVACAGGSIVVLPAVGGQAITIQVEPDATACPLAALDLPLKEDTRPDRDSEEETLGPVDGSAAA